jgi:hypothetical protein
MTATRRRGGTPGQRPDRGPVPPGVPATEVARRAGHSVVVLLKMYAHRIDGQADTANKRVADALGGGENGPDEQD